VTFRLPYRAACRTVVEKAIPGATLNGTRNFPDTDFENLSSLTAFSQLFTSELRLLTGPLALAEFKRPEVILREAALASEAHIPLDSVARFTGQNAAEERVPDCPTWAGFDPRVFFAAGSIFDARFTMIAALAASTGMISSA
jgi:hypothetical protein